MMTVASATALAKWMLREHPGIFATILKQQGRALSGLGDASTDTSGDIPLVDVTAQYINPPDQLQPVDVTASYITPGIDTSAADATTSGLLSNFGSNIAGAVSNVASFLLKGTAALAPVAIAAINSKTAQTNSNAQAAVLAAQMSRAGAGMSPANVTYTANGTPVYIPSAPATGGLTTIPAGLGSPVTLPNGQVGYTVTPQALSNLQPTFLQKYGIFILGGGAILAAVLLFS